MAILKLAQHFDALPFCVFALSFVVMAKSFSQSLWHASARVSIGSHFLVE